MSKDRWKVALTDFIDLVTRRIDYCALYPAKVNAQNADGTLEVTPEAAKIPKLSKVPLRLGLPGVTVKVSSGARVLLGFENGNSTKPFGALWDTSSFVEMRFNGGTIPVAKEGSVTAGHTHAFTLTAPPGGGPVTGSIASMTDSIAVGQGSQTIKVP